MRNSQTQPQMQRSSGRTRSVRAQIMMRVIPGVIMISLIIGIAGLLAIRANATRGLEQTHQNILNEASGQIDSELQEAINDVSTVAVGEAAQQFATMASSGITGDDFNVARNRLLNIFLGVARERPDSYLGIRILTRDGTVWSEVVNRSGANIANPVPQPELLEADPALRSSITVDSGTVVFNRLTEPNAEGQDVPLLRFSAPVTHSSSAAQIVGAIQLDVPAANVIDSVIGASNLLPIGPQSRLLLVNNAGDILADSSSAAADIEAGAEAPDVSAPTSETDLQIARYLRGNLTEFTTQRVDNNLMSARFVPLRNGADMPWRLVLVEDASVALGSTDVLSGVVLVASVVLGVLIILLINAILRQALRPLGEASAAVQQMALNESGASGAVSELSDVSDGDQDEIGELLRAVHRNSQFLRAKSADLETEIDRRTRNLEIAASISRQTTTLRDVEEILNQTITLICEEFGFYHAQVYLVDDIGLNAVLAYSRGEVGRKLLEQGHKMLVGSQSVIGRVTATGAPVLLNDTSSSQNIPHSVNPLLSETRAEMALPLLIGSTTIGALDIQSTRANVFDEEEIGTFQLLADQVAIAIYNARLFAESEQRIDQIDTLNRQLTRMAWDTTIEEVGLADSYSYDLLSIERDQVQTDDGTITALSAPITIRGEHIGTLAAAAPEGDSFTENDHIILRAVADRVALAIENARLFQDSQTSLAETSVLYQMSRYLNEANTLEAILEAIIQSVMPDAIAGQIWVFDDYTTPTPDWLEINVDWRAVTGTLDAAASVAGQRLYMNEHALLRSLSGAQVTLITDTQRDNRLDADLFNVFNRIGTRAVVFIPFSVRGVWRGQMVVEFPEPRQFNEREGRIYSALIDQAGVAIDNRLLLQQTELALDQIERLYTASRILNTAQDAQDLVRAAMTSTAAASLNFALGVLEGALDTQGWPTLVRIIARSGGGKVAPVDELYEIHVSEDAPLRKREPQTIIDDDLSIPDLTRPVAEGNRFAVVFPLFSANQPIALFYLTSTQVHILSSEDYEVYRALTGQMSTVLQNRQLLRQTEQALDETRRLYQASRAINSAQDSNAVYRSASQYLAASQSQISRVSVLLAEPEPTYSAPYMDYAYLWASQQSGAQLPENRRLSSVDAPFGSLIEQSSGTVLYYNDLEHAAITPPLVAVLRRWGANSAIVAPVQLRQKWFGVLICESDSTNAFDEGAMRFVGAIADQIAIAVENRQLFEEAQLQAQRALALAEAGQFASRIGSEFERGLTEVLTRVSEPAGYDRWLLLLSDDTDELQQTSQKLPDDLPTTGENVFMEIDRRSLMAAIRDSRALTINDPASDPIFADAPEGVVGLVGRHIVELIQPGDDVVGALLVGRSLNDEPMDERDQQLAATLAAQIGIAYENRRLFRSAEGERQTLSSILETLPAGVLVLDARTFKPIQFNRQTENLLGQSLSLDRAFSAADYNLYRTGTNVYYPDEELPVFTAARSGGEIFSDDVAVIHENGVQTDLLVNAAPIHNAEGDVIAIVAAFQDISNLRGLENALQDNLRETIALYEATRSLSEAEEIEDVMSVIVMQLAGMNGTDAYVVLLDEQGVRRVVRAMVADTESVSLPDAMMDSARMLLVSSVERFAPLDAEARAQLQAQGIQSFVSAPLLARRNVAIGWAVVVYDEPHSFTPEEERFLTTLSDNAATTIDNRNLFVSTQSALQETASLYNATTAISRATTLDDLGQALQNALESMQPDWYAAYIVNGEGESGKLQTLFNLSADGGPSVDFEALAVRHSLIRDDNVYIDDLATLTAGGKPNGDSDPLMQALAGLGARSLASVSLRAKGTSSGRLFLAYNRPRRFTDGDARYLGALTDSASVIIDNILLFEQIQSNLEETSILYQASRALGDVTRPEEILDIVINYLMQPGVTQIFMGLLTSPTWDAPEAAIRVIASWQRDDSSAVDLQDVTLTAEQFPAWEQLTSTTVMGIDDVENDARITPAQRAGIASLDVSSLLVIPLRAANRAIGIIWIASHDTHVHSDRELRVYQAFAEQASITLEASRLLEQTGRRARQLQTSAQVSQFASSVLDLSILLPRLVDLIRDAFGYDHVQIFLMNDIDDFAHLTASTGEAGQQLLAIRHKLQKGSASVIGQVTANVVPVVALDTADARVVHRPNPYLPFTRSEMALPLIIKGEVVGALDVQSNLPNFFSEEDVNVLTTLAAQISVAIDNARLFERAERRASDMSFLFAVTTAAASAENLNDALQNAAELLRDSLSTMSVTVYLPEVYLDEHEDAHTLMRAVAMAGSDQPISEISEVRVGDESNVIGVTAASFEPMVIDNIDDENRYLPVVSEARSAIIVPLSSGTDLIGLITMEDAALNAYDHEALTLLLTLSGTLSAIIQNAQLLQRVQQSNDQLRELDRLKSDFLANMSHELRTPLNSIIGFSRVILKGIDGPLTEMQEQDLTTIYNSGQHLLGLINDILDQAKIASGKMDLQQDHFEVKPLLDGVRSIGIGLVKDKPIDIRIETAAGLPRAYGDEFRTRQVLINLVSNAAKFTNKGTVIINAYPTQDANTGRDMIRIDVTDSGIGIADKDIPLLFEAFRQVDSSLTRTVGGTGLGLPIAKSLIEMQDGQIIVTSRVNVGSTFSILMPTNPLEKPGTGPLSELGDGEAPDDTSATGNRTREVSTTSFSDTLQTPHAAVSNGGGEQSDENGKGKGKSKKRDTVQTFAVRGGATGPLPPMAMPTHRKREILLIEDNPDMVDQYRRALQREGFDIQTATIPLEATAMASAMHPTIIIMDVNFAGGKGWEILERLSNRDDTRDIPIVVVSLSREEQRIFETGAFKFIQRPFTPDELTEAAREAEQESNTDRILIIDDQPESARLLKQMLDESGRYRVFTAESGGEGISLVARRRPNLVILDLRMPEKDGFEVLEELRTNPETANIPVLIVTGDTLDAEERDQLADTEVMYKTNITEDEHQQFLKGVRTQLSKTNGDRTN